MNHNGYLTAWSAEKIEMFKHDAVLYSLRELAVMYNIPSKSTISSLIKRLGLPPVTPETRKRLMQKATDASKRARERMTQEQIDDMNAKSKAAYRALIRSERRRIAFGLPQRTRLNLSPNPMLTKKRAILKGRIVSRNHYISREYDSRILLYDADTIRSEYYEKTYANVFTFLPVNGKELDEYKWVGSNK